MRSNNILLIALTLLGGCAAQAPAPGPAPAAQTANAGQVAPEQRKTFAAALDAMHRQQWKQAEKALLVLATKNAKLTGVHTNLGIVYYRLNDDARAEQSLKRALALDGARPLVHNYLGMVHRRQGRFQEARAAYEEALRLAPNYANACLNLGVLHDLYLGAPQQALDYYERYQALLDKEDDQVKRWILDLRRRTATKTAGGPG